VSEQEGGRDEESEEEIGDALAAGGMEEVEHGVSGSNWRRRSLEKEE
jgi:hypothetical protein